MNSLIRFSCIPGLLIISLVAFSQDNNAGNKPDKQNIKVITDQEAHYPFGTDSLISYIQSNIQYQEEARNKPIIGEILLSCTVNTDSTISNIQQFSTLGYGIDEEVIRILGTIKFAPQIQNGLAIKANIMLSIPFRVRIE